MKIVLGLSGGVDSSVALKLLLDQGYDVTPVFMRNWDSATNNDILGNPTVNDDICPQEVDFIDAKKVADKLNVEIKRVDFIEEYWNDVFSYFLDEYKKDRTPNPDIMCNKYIKFNAFLKYAEKIGADYIAMGHYANVRHDKDKSYLLRAKDQNKDQTYFLSQVSTEQLKDVLFPIGDLTKDEVRKIAKEANIPVYNKKDSTGICFIGERHYQQFIANYLKGKQGDIINVETNEVIGKHKGLMNYTIGQRRNVGIRGFEKRHYVCGKDSKKNILYVAFGDDSEYLLSDEAIIEDMNYISDKKPKKATAKFRYRSEDVAVEIEYLNNNQIKVKYKDVKSVTPGQACVIYDKDECLMGGIIKKVFKNNNELWYLK